VPDNDTRLRALETAFKLRGSYPSAHEEEAIQTGVKVIILDMPRPQRGVVMPDVKPGDIPTIAEQAARNGAKPEK
jgi:hypothetical protein